MELIKYPVVVEVGQCEEGLALLQVCYKEFLFSWPVRKPGFPASQSGNQGCSLPTENQDGVCHNTRVRLWLRLQAKAQHMNDR